MHRRGANRLLAVVAAVCLWSVGSTAVRSEWLPVNQPMLPPEQSEARRLSREVIVTPMSHVTCPPLYGALPPRSPHSLYPSVPWNQLSSRTDGLDVDRLWRLRYAVYQELISQGSAPLLTLPEMGSGGINQVCLLHGRNDVVTNAQLIRIIGRAYPEVPPIIVAGAIAQQASDVERVFGVDILEQVVLGVPGLENMSIGIAQLRPTEAHLWGLGAVDLFDPAIAIYGMFTKVQLSVDRIAELQNPLAPVRSTDRYMLLSLAQNSPRAVDDFFKVGGDWSALLAKHNNTRVMRYYLVHFDWLVAHGWELPSDVDLEVWRSIVFSARVRDRDGAQ